MEELSTNLEILKSDNGKVIGFEVFADKNKQEAVSFCESFPSHFTMGVADIKVKDGKIFFFYPGLPNFLGCQHSINPEEGDTLDNILNNGESGFELEKYNGSRPGFRIVKK